MRRVLDSCMYISEPNDHVRADNVKWPSSSPETIYFPLFLLVQNIWARSIRRWYPTDLTSLSSNIYIIHTTTKKNITSRTEDWKEGYCGSTRSKHTKKNRPNRIKQELKDQFTLLLSAFSLRRILIISKNKFYLLINMFEN